MKKNKFLGKTKDGKFIIKGINIYRYTWVPVGNCIIVMDPTSDTPISLSVYKAEIGENTYFFASGKLSDKSTGFFEYN